jgi:sporulation protein YlmC with PRC-barrel domain
MLKHIFPMKVRIARNNVRTALEMGAAIALLLAASSALCQTRSHPRPEAEFQNDLVRRLIGMSVENVNAEKLGVIKNFILDLQSGQAKYGLISSGSFLGVGPRLKIVPAQALSGATTKKGVVSLDISKRRWENAPVFKKGDLLKLSDPAWTRRISQFYGQAPEGAAVSTPAAIALPVPPHSKGQQTGHEDRGSPPAGSLRLASDILGRGVMNRHQEVVGKISDLLVDLGTQRPAFAIISDTKSSDQEKTFAVPLRSLKATAEHKFTVDADRRVFAEAKPFDDRSWPASSTNTAEMVFQFENR